VGERVHSIDITLTRRTVGLRGIQLIGTDASGVMRLTHTVDHASEDDLRPGTFHFSFEEVIGQYPYAVRPAMDFILAMEPDNRLSVHLGHARMGFVDVTDDCLDGARPVARLVVALDELQRYFGVLFPVPDGLTFRDVRELEVARQLIAGEQAQWLGHLITMQIPADRLKDFLASDGIQNEPATMVVKHESMSFACGEQSFDVGPVQVWGSRMRLANRRELEEAVSAGIEATARWECTDGEHLYIRQADHTDD